MKTKLLLSALFVSALMQAQTYTNNTTVVIPDPVAPGVCGNSITNPSAPGISSINVPISAIITDPTTLTINLNLTHVWVGDVIAVLETPAGTNCALIKRIPSTTDAGCGSGSDFVGANTLSFNSANATPVPTTNPVPAGNYAPTGTTTYPAAISLCNLTTFLNGVQINGDWKINAYDTGVGDVGEITSWSIVYTGLSGEEFVFSNAISVLGNPFENELVVKVNNLSTTSAIVNLYSVDGKLVNKTTLTNFEESTSIETSKLTHGVYLLIAEIDGVAQKAIRVIKK